MVGKIIKFGIVGAVILGVGWLFYSGRLKKEDAEELGRAGYYKARGAASKVINVGPSGGSGAGGGGAQCRKNLHNIERAKRVVARDMSATVGALPKADVIKELGGAMPRCPSGGKYTFRNIEMLPRCSIGNQGNLEKGDDHVILQY